MGASRQLHHRLRIGQLGLVSPHELVYPLASKGELWRRQVNILYWTRLIPPTNMLDQLDFFQLRLTALLRRYFLT